MTKLVPNRALTCVASSIVVTVTVMVLMGVVVDVVSVAIALLCLALILFYEQRMKSADCQSHLELCFDGLFVS